MPVDLTNFENGQIVAYRDCGKSYKYIADKLHKPRSTISTFYIRYHADNNHRVNNRNRSGRHSLTNANTHLLFVNASLADPFKPATQIRRELAPTLRRLHQSIPSIESVRQNLRKAGLRSRTPAVKLRLSDVHKLHRYYFAEAHINWADEWNFVIFSDESTFQIGRSGIQSDSS